MRTTRRNPRHIRFKPFAPDDSVVTADRIVKAAEERSHEACLYIRKFEASVVLTGITLGRLQFREDKS